MSIQWLCVAFLPLLFLSVQSTIHWECLAPNVGKCEKENIKRITDAVAENPPNYEAICLSVEVLIQCAQIDCGGESWDPTDDYLTKLLDYSKATGLCGDPVQTNSCAVKVSKGCIKKMGQYMKKINDPCIYYGMYAGCVIKAGPVCRDDTTTAFAEEMKRQIREKMPTVFGATTVDMCPRWPRMYQMFLNQRG